MFFTRPPSQRMRPLALRATVAALAIAALVPLTALVPSAGGSASAATATTTFENTSAQVEYSGSWRVSGSRADSGGSVNFQSTAGSASFSFTGTSVAYISRLTSSSGTSTVSIDGNAVATVSGYSATTTAKQSLYATTTLSDAPHTITVARTGKKDSRSTGTNSIIDAFVTSAVASTAPAIAPIIAHRYADCPVATVNVTNAAELKAAVTAAAPGTVIKMAAGTYDGQVNVSVNGTATQPVWICGPHTAVINAGSVQDNHGIQITNSSNLVVAGMSVTNSLKGISVIRSNHVTVADTAVYNIGYEGIHVRAFGTDNVVVGNTISNTGQRNPFYGEGIYIGTSENNWCAQTNCLPDRTDRTLLMDNTVSLTGAQPIEVKEGTTGGIIRDNVLDGTNGLAHADEWVKVKGNDYAVYSNTGKNSTLHGFTVNGSVTGWGLRNTFYNNTAVVNASGFGYHIYEKGAKGSSSSTVYCSNGQTGAASGLSNLACTS